MVEPTENKEKKVYNPTKKDEVETLEILNMTKRKHKNRATNFLSQ